VKALRLLRKCLEKDPKEKRLRDIGDWDELLEDRSLTVAAPKGVSMMAPWGVGCVGLRPFPPKTA
jgi:hypothetical protein